MSNPHILYECGICGGVHPWDWDADCRDDENRYADAEDFAERNKVSVYDIEVRSMEERLTADGWYDDEGPAEPPFIAPFDIVDEVNGIARRDPAEDGPEIDLIRFFRAFPDGVALTKAGLEDDDPMEHFSYYFGERD